jgi:hypothetical protein
VPACAFDASCYHKLSQLTHCIVFSEPGVTKTQAQSDLCCVYPLIVSCCILPFYRTSARTTCYKLVIFHVDNEQTSGHVSNIGSLATRLAFVRTTLDNVESVNPRMCAIRPADRSRRSKARAPAKSQCAVFRSSETLLQLRAHYKCGVQVRSKYFARQSLWPRRTRTTAANGVIRTCQCPSSSPPLPSLPHSPVCPLSRQLAP